MTASNDSEPQRQRLAHRLGQWLLDDERKEADLGRLMKYNIVISFLTLALVAGDATVVSDMISLMPF